MEIRQPLISDKRNIRYKEPILCVADSWFGNNGLWAPVRKKLGDDIHLLSRLRSNNNLFDLPAPRKAGKRGRPPKYGALLANPSELAPKFRDQAKPVKVELYGRIQEVMAYDRIFMVKTLKCPIRVVWIYRKTQWVALFTTDLSLSVTQIIEYYGARWKIESGFKELDVSRHITEAVLSEDFPRFCSQEGKSAINSITQAAKAMLRMVA